MARIAVRLAFLISVLCLTGESAIAQYGRPPPPPSVYVIHGVRRTCDSIDGFDRALTTEDPRYFAGWTPADYDAAAAMASACVVNGYQYFGPARVAHLREYQRKVFQPPPPPPTPQHIADAAAAQQRIADEQEAERRASDKAAARADALARTKELQEKKVEAERAARANAVVKCRHSDEYHLYQAQERVLADLETKNRIDAVMAREKKIENISGVQNMTREYEIGAEIVRIDEQTEKDWATYASLGGSATSSDAVMRSMPNPCQGTTLAESQD